jgi:DNA polymerase III alpha subunit
MSINAEKQLSQAVINHGLDILSKACIDPREVESYLKRIYDERLDYPIPRSSIDHTNWNIPQEYKDMDIESYLVSVCPEKNYDRLQTELELYHRNNMIPVLKSMKHVVDTLRKNNVVWGVGRGSSVASYVLFLIGVHKVDSVKYNLPIEEFFKEI